MMAKLWEMGMYFEFVVIGGGISGVCAALAAARHGVKTALIQDRPVLGGNASSEIRMHICGADRHGSVAEARETGIVEEIQLKNRARNPQHSFSVQDSVLWEMALFQENLKLFLNTTVTDVFAEEGVLKSVLAYQMTTERHLQIDADYFADCTGDGTIARKAGLQFAVGTEGREVYGEEDAPEHGSNCTMGSSVMFVAKDMGRPCPFTPPPWAYHFTEEDLKYRGHSYTGSGYWWIEYGGDALRVIEDAEEIRDELIKIVFGIWDHIKNTDKAAQNYALDWFNFLPGKRESRRLMGEYVLTETDIRDIKWHFDDIAYGGWKMDVHTPGGILAADREPTTYFETNGIYGIPYRCLYSVRCRNLWIGGRAISVSHMAYGSTRVMGTCGVVGQAIGCAAFLAKKYRSDNAGVLGHIDELQQTLLREDCYIPNVQNHDATDIAPRCEIVSGNRDAALVVDGFGRNDVNGLHRCDLAVGEEILLRLPEKRRVHEIILKFDSDLTHELTITISEYVRSKQQDFPQSLARDFELVGYLAGEEVYRQTVCDNFLRLRNFTPDREMDAVSLRITKSHGAARAGVYEIRICI